MCNSFHMSYPYRVATVKIDKLTKDVEQKVCYST